MRTQARSRWSRVAAAATLAAGVLLLAGCATGYRMVQAAAAGAGSYYTSSAPYSGAGYYDAYGTGPYYSGTSSWGYYNGSYPYVSVFAGYGSYPAWGYWPWFGFGISSVWNFPGYWGPWYSGYPSIWWGCRHRHCGHLGTHPHGVEAAQNLGVMSLRPALPSSALPTQAGSRTIMLPNDFRTRGADHWPRDGMAFDHERFVRAPDAMQRRIPPRAAAAPALPDVAPRPWAAPPQTRAPAEFAQPRSDGYRAQPRAAPRPSFQPRARAPEAAPAPHPRDNHSPDMRRH